MLIMLIGSNLNYNKNKFVYDFVKISLKIWMLLSYNTTLFLKLEVTVYFLGFLNISIYQYIY